ncbi:hypothetical protein CB0940_01776 [Cercospora beticola]|uniref:Uncharacterized protein n=1 Tax=Cercospora beticola TaxID=122368 RepID=A0A2G5IAN4_CERBT|nr:hypothetical protein CB0940_01776 [Cercospora beticola]PIB01533.1 hypothetical protein CB0940_01776 [Cercospora beticola]WPA97227.1 hypothetical protein RHO25_001836 [Cercospora beticola]
MRVSTRLREVLSCDAPAAARARLGGFLALSAARTPTNRAYHSPSPTSWKTLQLQGHERIVGKGRKRQRVESAELQRKALNEATSVIVLRDAQDDTITPAPRPGHSSLSAREVEDAITGQGPAPDEVEVNASIDSLRPDSSILETAQFETLRERLAHDYKLPQLLQYLRANFRPDARLAAGSALKAHGKGLQASPWQPDRTPLQVRRTKLVKPSVASRKLRTAERVLRLAWGVTVFSEEQEVGELELALQPWQLSMLFDLSGTDDNSYYQNLISAPFLLEATKIEQYPPDSILRITGRRRDAEEVAYQLELALSAVRPMRINFADLGVPASAYCSDEELALVSRTTKSVIVSQGRNLITIYNRTDVGANHARRLLLSMLNLSTFSAATTTSAYIPSSFSRGDKRKPSLLPVDSSVNGLHIRQRSEDLARQVQAYQEFPAGTEMSSAQRHRIATEITERLHEGESMLQSEATESQLSGYWRGNGGLSSNWRADFVKFLQTDAQPNNQKAVKHRITQYRLPGIESALSSIGTYRAPHRIHSGDAVKETRAPIDLGAPQLRVHLVPKPTQEKTSHSLPQVQLLFGFSADEERELMFAGMRAIVQTRIMQVPLPCNAVDLLFTQNQTLFADLDAARQDPEIANFAREVQRSMQAKDEVLSAPPELNILLPSSLVSGQTQTPGADQQIPVTYLLERFEQTQSRIFGLKNDFLEAQQQELQGAKFDTPDNDLRLEYKEVDGGTVFGPSTKLTLKAARKRTDHDGDSQDANTDGVPSTAGGDDGAASLNGSKYFLASTALAVADSLTKAAQGSLSKVSSV